MIYNITQYDRRTFPISTRVRAFDPEYSIPIIYYTRSVLAQHRCSSLRLSSFFIKKTLQQSANVYCDIIYCTRIVQGVAEVLI